ncbi:MAG: hypothetical protein J2P25_08345 [Nocardiopsaceae bacterium]|nr:hypothetical protein [Nocardiopsaceae bacterium]
MSDQHHRPGWLRKSTEAGGTGSVAIAGNNHAPVSTNVFMGDWFPLLQAYLDPSSLDAQLNSESFVGRKWLFDEIDKFITANPNGYFVIEADAGMGKTAFAHQLAKRGKHASHFSCLDWRARSSESAIRNISAQLIAAWNLTELVPQGMLPPGSDRPSWLWQVLSAAAARRDKIDPAYPLVLVIDAFDDAEAPRAGTMPFGLPPNLPPRVFVVATTRTGTSLPALRQPYRTRLLEAGSAANEWDMERYLRSQLAQPWLTELLDTSRTNVEMFSRQLLERCSGVWIYLAYVLSEIRYGLRDLRDVVDLPTDLDGYYAQNIDVLSQSENWLTWYLPLLATLGVAAEPLNGTQLAKFASIEHPEHIRRFLFTRFRPFCDVTSNPDNEEKFFLYHRSLVEFLSGDSKGSELSGNQGLKAELRRAKRIANARICDHFSHVWGEASEYYPVLGNELALAELENGYAVRHIVHHLDQAGRQEDIEAIISSRRQHRNLWYEAHDRIDDWDGYLRDVQLARRAMRATTDTALESGVSAPTLGTECRYALLLSSITSQTAQIPLPLLEALVSTETWSGRHVLEHIRRINDRTERATSYIHVIPYLTGPHRLLACHEALAASTGIGNPEIRANTLISLVPLVPRTQKALVLEKAHETGVIQPWEYLIETLTAYCGKIDENLFSAIFDIIRQVSEEKNLAPCSP